MGEDRYKLIVARDHTEQYFRDMWSAAYCKQEIYTFDGIRVYFYDDNFDHAFYESTDRRPITSSIPMGTKPTVETTICE